MVYDVGARHVVPVTLNAFGNRDSKYNITSLNKVIEEIT
jgi:hypothetical protein